MECTTSTDDVESIERGFLVDALGIALIGKTLLGDSKLKMLSHLESADDLAHPQPDLRLTFQGTLASLGSGDDLIKLALGGL
jgi:hypothetical protein